MDDSWLRGFLTYICPSKHTEAMLISNKIESYNRPLSNVSASLTFCRLKENIETDDYLSKWIQTVSEDNNIDLDI